MHYFPAWTEKFILSMPWVNFMLYMASIPSYEKDEAPDEAPLKVKDAADSF